MSWLNQYKKKFADEDAKKNMEENEKAKDALRRDERAKEELNRFVNSTLTELEGKKTKDGKALKIKRDLDNYVKLMADDEELLALYFHYTEDSKCDDGEGYPHYLGTYTLEKKVYFSRPFTSRYGYKHGPKYHTNLYDGEEMAVYLLEILK